MEIHLSEITCLRCNHKWQPRVEQVRMCPNCHSPYWNAPKTRFQPRYDGPYKADCDTIKLKNELESNEDYQNRLKIAEYKLSLGRELKQKIRAEVLAHYGTSQDGIVKCSCCNEDNMDFLTIDHINGDGAAHKRQIKLNLDVWLKKNGYPLGFQVLCYNCNCSKGKPFNGNTCPHTHPKTRKVVNGKIVLFDNPNHITL